MLVVTPPMKSMQIDRPSTEACVSACHVGAGPFETSVSSDQAAPPRRGTATRTGRTSARHWPCRSSRLPTAKLTGEIMIIRKCGDAEIIADGAADHQKADRGRSPMPTPCIGVGTSRNISAAKRDGEQRLALHDDAGKADRHAMRNAKGLRQELAEEQREADRDQHRPGDGRLAHQQAWQRRDREAQRRHQFAARIR